MKKIILLADSSNWKAVTDKTNLEARFECPNGKAFTLKAIKSAHKNWEGEKKVGAQAEVKVKFTDCKNEETFTTNKLKNLVGVEKEAKERSPKRTPERIFADLWAEMQGLQLSGFEADALAAMKKAYSEAEAEAAEKAKKEAERAAALDKLKGLTDEKLAEILANI